MPTQPATAWASAPAWAAGVLAVFLLGGCASVPPAGPAGAGRPADPAELTQWMARGRIALTAHGEGGSGSFVWQQRSELTELTVRGPLGAGGLRIVTDGTTLEVEDGSGQPLDGDAARAAIERRLGVGLPLAQFRYWMLGVPAPETPGGPSAGASTVGPVVQGGWTVEYEAFQPAGPWSLPARLTATAPEARVRIVIDDWQLPAAGP